MSQRLSDEDSRAVDLLLDRSNTSTPRSGNGNGGSGYVSTAPDELQQRMRSAEKLLQVFAEMPASEPPSDLVRRTMARIEQYEESRTQRGTMTGEVSDDSRPTL